MSEQTPEQPEKWLTLSSDTDERLSQLHAAYAEAKPLADAAAARVKDITDAIKATVTEAAPGETHIVLGGSAGAPLQLTYSESWRVDSKRLKSEDPNTYVRFAVKSGRWSLRTAKAGASE